MPIIKLVPCCPKQHEDLQLRMVVDVPFVVEHDTDEESLLCEGDVADPKGDVQFMLENPGVNSGVWCPVCEEWYDELTIQEASRDRNKLV